MSTPLIIVPPLAIADAMVDPATTVPEDSSPAWSAEATYSVDQRAHVNHVVYQSAQNGNLNNPPATSSDWWVKVGPTNRWALFDGSRSTQTLMPNSGSYTLKPVGAMTVLAVLNAKGCIRVRVRVSHPSQPGPLYDRTISMASVPTTPGIWAWFFGERRAPEVLVLLDLPGIPGCTIVVDFTGTTAQAVGVLLLGQPRRVGIGVKAGVRVGIDDYSKKEPDDWGQTVLVQGNYVKRCSLDVPVEADKVEGVINLLTSRRGLPTLYIGSSKRGSTVIFGFYSSWEVVHAYADLSELTMDLKDLA